MSTGLSISLMRTREGGADRICCRACGHAICRADELWKDAAVRSERPLSWVSPLYTSGSPALIREFVCPACGLLLDAEVARSGDPALLEIFGRGASADGSERP